MTETSLEDISNRNMAEYYRSELAQVKRGRRPNINIIRALFRLDFVVFLRRSERSGYRLTEKARTLLRIRSHE